MSLAPGSRLGPYQIQSALGAGGMGEVWKARDERLDRRQWERWENEGGALFVPPDERSAAGPAGGSR